MKIIKNKVLNFRKYKSLSCFVLVISAVFILFSENSSAQKQQFDRASYYSYGIRLFSEAHTLPDSSSDSINVLVLYKIVYSALSFIQVNPLENPGQFQAISTVEIFFRDISGIIRNRTLNSDTIWAKNYEDTQSKDIYTYGFLNTKLPISDYDCTVQLLDRFKKASDKSEIKIKSNLSFLVKPVISDPIFTYSSEKLPEYKTIPFVLGNKINFTSSDAKILVPVSYQPNYNVFNYIIEKNTAKDDKFWNEPINISGRAIPSEGSRLTISKDFTHNLVLTVSSGFQYNPEKTNDVLVGIININLPSAQLSPGSYNIKVFTDGKNDTSKYDFDVIWVDMPLAMRNPNYAAEMMYYILNDDEFKKLNSGSDSEKARKIMEYWTAKDPTPKTPYNEAMTEYFRRVDYAFFNFQTIRDKDGAKTERGKIHILFGKPENTEKNLISGKQFEIWTYEKLKKTFFFELASNGLYILRKIEE